MNRLTRLFTKIENINAPLSAWLLTFFSIIFIKIFLENFSTSRLINYPQTFHYVFVHYLLFYFTVFLTITLTLYWITKITIAQLSKIGVFSFMLEWIHPISDLIIFATSGKHYIQSYLVTNPTELPGLFFSFLGPLVKYGATPGIRIQIIVAAVLLFLYLRARQVPLLKIALAFFLIYTFLFMIGSLPTVIGAIVQLANNKTMDTDAVSVARKLAELIAEVPLLRAAGFTTSSPYSFSLFSRSGNSFLGLVYIAMLAVLANAWFYAWNKNKWLAFISNVRLSWLLVYVAYIGTGIWIASIYGSLNVFSFGFWLSSISLLIGFTAVYLLSIQINDEYDLEIDSLSNTGRPLVRKRLQREDYRNINSILVLFAFFAGASLGFEIIFPFLVLSGLSYLYSAPPLRLKRIPLLSNVLLGFGVATVILVGFNFSGIPPYRFPLQTFTILFAIVTLLNLSKDLKDRESDRTTGITTWANYLTKEKSLLIASAALIAAGMLTGIFVNSLLAGLISISIAFFASRLIFKDPSRDISLLVNFILFSGIVTKLLLPYL